MVARNARSAAELRKKPRRQFSYRARILASESGPASNCAIADISQTGARIVLERDEDLPKKFILLLSDRGDARRVCRLVWRHGLTLGVEFPAGHS